MAIRVVKGTAAELPSPHRIKFSMKKRENTTLKSK
jgi:hypothetical protein